MKNSKIIAILFLLMFAKSIFSEATFEHPMRVEPVAVYSKVRVDASAAENRQIGVYKRDTNLSFECEVKFLDVFSVKAQGGGTRYETTNEKTRATWDRPNLGLKFGMVHGGEGFRFGWGGGVRVFNKQVGQNPRNDVAPDLYLVKPHLSMGIGAGSFELILEAGFQTETNAKFRESPRQEFKRNYNFGLSLSFGVTNWMKVFLETQYIQPYDKKIDLNIRGWYAYPGVSFKIYETGRLTASFLIPVSKEDYLYEKGLKLSYFHFFNY
jgi:hypothetical protein